MGFGVSFRISCFVFQVSCVGLGFGVWSLGFGVWGFAFVFGGEGVWICGFVGLRCEVKGEG